ncbi:hypothetical protein [Phytoactinopolyspora limicola]|uniref:hypothetical protein n=1 Tax=Phytoactinopolyspora limicola TaxID=2715536 RepID=UPI00140CC0CF|nr:hypothetical protein [Phytoactinopolyspora limicola]
MYGNNPLPQTGFAAGPLALLFNGASLIVYVLLGMALVVAGFVLMRTYTHQRSEA